MHRAADAPRAVDPPELLLLLYSDRADPVAAAIAANARRFPMPLLALSIDQLADSLVVSPALTWQDRTIDPARSAVVNRLTSFSTDATAERLAAGFQQQRLWTWLHALLRSFAYVSSMPTPSSILGGYGSLLDQWLDLPELVPGLCVPAHHTPWSRRPLGGDVYAVNPWNLYSLGKRVPPQMSAAPGAQLTYARPDGVLVHVSQVGGAVMFGNTPPHMTQRHRAAILSFTEVMAFKSQSRILEHAFFIGNDEPVFYSTCPVPVITGTLPHYPQLVVEGLQDDFARHSRHAAA